MPLVASFALLGRLRWRRPVPEWLIWHVMALVGIVLALGGFTPLWHLLIRVPLFGAERLQSRNILIADMGFAFLLAYWADAWLADGRAPRDARAGPVPAPEPAFTAPMTPMTPRAPLSSDAGSVYGRRARTFGAVPGLLAVAIVTVGIGWGAGLLRWLGVSAPVASADSDLRWWFLPFGVLGLGAVALVLGGHRLDSRRRARTLVGFVIVDIAIFIVMAVVPLATNLGQPSAKSIATPTVQAGASPGASVPTPPTRRCWPLPSPVPDASPSMTRI